MTISKKIMAAITAAFVCVASLAGCSSGDDSSETKGAEPPKVEQKTKQNTDTVQRGEYTLPRSVAEKLEEIENTASTSSDPWGLMGVKIIAEQKDLEDWGYMQCAISSRSTGSRGGCNVGSDPIGEEWELRTKPYDYGGSFDEMLGRAADFYDTKDFSEFGFIMSLVSNDTDLNKCSYYQLKDGGDVGDVFSGDISKCEVLE